MRESSDFSRFRTSMSTIGIPEEGDVLYRKLAGLNAGLWFRIFVQTPYDHFGIGLRLRQLRFRL